MRASPTLGRALGWEILNAARQYSSDRIVIDVRDNSGGDNTLFRGLVAALEASEFNTRGRLFVLINGGTFSAATNFVSTMERRTRAVFVGSPTGSGPNHFGDSRPLLLPHTRILIMLSTREHRFADDDDRRVAHVPHVPMPVTSRDYFAGRDPVLDAALTWRPERQQSVVKVSTAFDPRCIPVGGVAPSLNIGRIFSVVAPCPRGASRVSVLAATFTTDCQALLSPGSD